MRQVRRDGCRVSRRLASVRAAQTRHQRECAASWDRYLQAIRAARQAGHTLEEIGQTVGISKQGVYYLLNPDPRKAQKT